MDNMKKVLFLTHYFPPEVTAAANRTFEHIKRWQQQGLKVTVITNYPNHPNGEIPEDYQNKLFTRENYRGIEVIRVKTYATPNKGTYRRTLNFIVYFLMSIWVSFYTKKVDVIIATSPQFLCGLAGAVIKRMKNKPFILEIRDLWPDSIIAVGALKEGNPVIKFLEFLEKKMYNAATHIIPLTNAFKDHIAECGYSKENITVIPNSVDLKQLENVVEVNTDFKKNGKFVCSYIGTFGMAHKLGTILDTAALLREEEDIHFLLIGDGAERKKLVEKKEKMGLDNVTLLPLQPKKNIPYFLELSDIGLIVLRDSKLFETVIPSKIFEYMAKDNALILSMPKGETTRLLNQGQFGVWVPPQSPRKFAGQIKQLYNNRDKVKAMAREGKHLVENYYNRDTLAGKMAKIIKTIA